MAETFDGGRLADDLRSLVSEAEALLRASTGAESRRAAGAGARERCRYEGAPRPHSRSR